MESDSDVEKEENPIWHPQQEKILKEWSEISSSYRWLHYQSHRKYKKLNMLMTIPVIVLSTISGTLNFSTASFQGTSIEEYVPFGIGTLNLIAGLVTTIQEFLKVSELSESHRTSSLSFGKLSRNIKVELSLPWIERTVGGREFLKMCRNDMDRLLEQSSEIPMKIVEEYEKKFGNIGIYKPEILEIHPVPIYNNEREIQEKHTGNVVANAKDILVRRMKDKKRRKNPSITEIMGPTLASMNDTIQKNNNHPEESNPVSNSTNSESGCDSDSGDEALTIS